MISSAGRYFSISLLNSFISTSFSISSLRVFISILLEFSITSRAHLRVKKSSCNFFSSSHLRVSSPELCISLLRSFSHFDMSDSSSFLVFSLSSQNLNAISFASSSRSFFLSSTHGFILFFSTFIFII